MFDPNQLTAEEHKELARLLRKANEFTKEEEEEFVHFFMGLIPILVDAYSDLEAKGLCPEEFKGMSKFRKLFKT